MVWQLDKIFESTDVIEACGFSAEISPFSPPSVFSFALRGQMIELSGKRELRLVGAWLTVLLPALFQEPLFWGGRGAETKSASVRGQTWTHPPGKEVSLDVGGNRNCRCPPPGGRSQLIVTHGVPKCSPHTKALRDMFRALLDCKYPLVGLGRWECFLTLWGYKAWQRRLSIT